MSSSTLAQFTRSASRSATLFPCLQFTQRSPVKRIPSRGRRATASPIVCAGPTFLNSTRRLPSSMAMKSPNVSVGVSMRYGVRLY
jgi:hypothetical protein